MIKMEAEAKRLWWEFQKSKGSLSGGQRAEGGRPASKPEASPTSELLSLPKEDVPWFLLEVRKKWLWVTCNFRKEKNSSNSEGRSLTEFTYRPLNLKEMPCTKSNNLKTAGAHCTCMQDHMGGKTRRFGTTHLSFGPCLKARIQRHITLPPEPPCVPRAPRRHSRAPHCTSETWQVWINPCRQTIPWFPLLALQVLPAIQPGKADICLVRVN